MGQQPENKEQIFSKPLERWAKHLGATKFVVFIVFAGFLATAIAAVYTFRVVGKRPTAEPSPTPTKTPEITAVSARGRIEPQGEVIELSASPSIQGAKVDQLLVSIGDRVGSNQVIAVLVDRDRLQAAVERAQKQVKVAKANLATVEAGAKTGTIGAQEATIKRLQVELIGERDAQQTRIARLETQLREAQIAQDATVRRLEAELRTVEKDFERFEQLAKQGVISLSELDSRKLEVETAIEQLKEAEANRTQTLETLQEELTEAKVTRSQTEDILEEQINEAQETLEEVKEVRPVDVQQAEAEVESALAAVEQAKAELELAYVRAPEAGRVLEINTQAGEIADQDKGIIELGRTDQMMVIAEVYESDISKVRLGQRASMISEGNAFEGEIRGSVSEIGLQIGKKDILDTDPAAAVDARVVEVKIRLNPEDSERVASLTNSQVIVTISL
ncbi:MAG: HlyD family efflux transporter periplasmic adaptor subunit [Symploca sp. SIO1A3]|nr:HlyD family efflux transporter periplasmic adaptor subunit [Symploca sp. SIO1A3]